MNKTPRTRFVTLMAAAAGVTAAVGSSISTPKQALASTATSATIMADTVKNKPATAKKTAAASKSPEAKKPAVTPKSVVSTATPGTPSLNDVNGDPNGDGTGY